MTNDTDTDTLASAYWNAVIDVVDANLSDEEDPSTETILDNISEVIARCITLERIERRGRPRKPRPENEEVKPPRPVGRPRKNNNPEIKIEKQPKVLKTEDPEYFKTYYQRSLKGMKVECPGCGEITVKVNLAHHKQSYKCKYLTSIKQNQN
jgi:ribosomal protein S27AE